MTPVDLSNCDREPIHLSGAIQPHGVLLALDAESLVIVASSVNVEDFLGAPFAEIIGVALESLFDEASLQRFRQTARTLGKRRALHPIPMHGRSSQRAFDGILHASGAHLILELEPRGEPESGRFSDFDQEMRDSLSRLHDAVSVLDLCRMGVTEIRRLTGFDRVMAYRFDRDDHGHVVAEAKREQLETYLDLHYPASDIPAQARRLYTVNWLRSIVDVAYRPVPIEPALGSPLDLSFSVLRSVSPIHVEYLKNMGIHASMSISVVVDGRLWGMFICHHYAPRFVRYEIRAAAEFLAQMLSWQISARDRADAAERRTQADALLRAIVGSVVDRSTSLEDLVTAPQPLLDLVAADGACIIHEGRSVCAGHTPPEHALAELVQRLVAEGPGPHATHELSRLHPPAVAYADIASGVLAVPLLGDGKSFVLWFRPEVVQTVSWAGQPDKKATLVDGVPRLSPRGSFALWRETVRNQSAPWEPWQIDLAVEFARSVAAGWVRRAAELERLNRQLQATAEELREANLAKDDFLATVSHELRNPLNAILGWVRLLRADNLPAERRAQGVDVIDRNARQQAKLVEDLLDVSRIVSGKLRLDIATVDLVETVALAVESLRPVADSKGLVISTSFVVASAPLLGDAARLQQVVENLLNNAIKFTPAGGRIEVRVERERDVAIAIVQDTGRGISSALLERLFDRFQQGESGPGRAHQGLGLGLSIVRHLVELHGGSIKAESAGENLGSRFSVRIPLQPDGGTHMASLDPRVCPALAGKTVLVVDDDDDGREALAAELTRCSAHVLQADGAEAALTALQQLRPALILSDVGMPGIDGHAFLRAVRLLPESAGGRTPAIALTAYARAEDRTGAFRAGYQAHVPKPVDLSELFAVISSLLRD